MCEVYGVRSEALTSKTSKSLRPELHSNNISAILKKNPCAIPDKDPRNPLILPFYN